MGDAPPTPPPSTSAMDPSPSYSDFLYGKGHSAPEDAPMRRLRDNIGWGLDASLRPLTGSLSYVPDMTSWLLAQMDSLVKDMLPPSAPDLLESLREWRQSATPAAYSEDGPEALRKVVIELAKDLFERHLAFKKKGRRPLSSDGDACAQSDDGGPSRPLSCMVRTEYGSTEKFFGLPGGHNTICGLRTDRVGHLGRTFKTFIVGLPQQRADHYLPEVVELAKSAGAFRMGVSSSEYDVNHLIQLVADLASDDKPCNVLLTSYHTSMLLRLSRYSDRRIIACSDIIKDCSILPALLSSLQVASVEPCEYTVLYRDAPWARIPAVAASPPPGPIASGNLRENAQELEDLSAPKISLAFAGVGDDYASEHYSLVRVAAGTERPHKCSQEEEDDDIDLADGCSQREEDDGTDLADNRPQLEEYDGSVQKPVLVACRQIGHGTCGEVYLAHYGRYRIAVKVCPSERGEARSLSNEYQTYLRIRAAGLEGKVTPRCFGLYKCHRMLVLLTAYSGTALTTFENLCIEDSLSIFRAAKLLEDNGIRQNSFSPRNVVCDENHVFRIIDFHRGTYKKGRKAAVKSMRDEYFLPPGWRAWRNDKLYLDWHHVVPIPESNDLQSPD